MAKKIEKWIKFASLDGSLRGWAPASKFAAMEVPEANLIDHAGHKDEVLADNGGKEILATCPANSANVIWRTIEAPPATPESLNPDVASLKQADVPQSTTDSRFNPQTGGWKIPCEMKGNGECSESGETMKVDNHFLCPKHHSIGTNASLVIEAHIRHEDGKWVIYSHDYKKKLGTYDTKTEALHRLKSIEYWKSHKGSLVKNPEGKIFKIADVNFETNMVELEEIK